MSIKNINLGDMQLCAFPTEHGIKELFYDLSACGHSACKFSTAKEMCSEYPGMTMIFDFVTTNKITRNGDIIVEVTKKGVK